MRTAVFAALLGMAAPAALLAQTSTPPTDPAVTGTMPADAGAAIPADATGTAATSAGGAAGTDASGTTGSTATGTGGASGSAAGGSSADGAAGATGTQAGASGTGDAAASQNPVVMPHTDAMPEPATAPADPPADATADPTAAAAAPAMTPQGFVDQAASSGMFEVQSSELALERSSTPEVQEFARMMILDHGELNEQLKALAAAQNLTVPAEVAGPPAQHLQAVMEAEGDAFDQAYLDHQAQAHAEAIALFEPWAAQTDDTNLAAFAQKGIQHMRTHQETLERIRGN